MPNMIVVSPLGRLDPLGNQQKRLIAVEAIQWIDPLWSTTAQTQTGPAATQAGSAITFLNGVTVQVFETLAQLQAAAV